MNTAVMPAMDCAQAASMSLNYASKFNLGQDYAMHRYPGNAAGSRAVTRK